MRITEALKPVTDMLAAVGMSLDTATYKDGKIHITLNTEASKVPKPEPVKLTDQEKIVGWRGPSGFRLQTFTSRKVPCSICKKMIKNGERLARWRSKFPEGPDMDHVVGRPEIEENHSHAHVDCLYTARGAHVVYGLSYAEAVVPFWLCEKRRKYDAQQSAP